VDAVCVKTWETNPSLLEYLLWLCGPCGLKMMLYGERGDGWFLFILFGPSSDGRVHDHRILTTHLLVTLCPKTVCFCCKSAAIKMLLLKKVDIEPKVLVLCWGSLINSMTFSGYIGMGAEGTMIVLHLHPCALSFVPPVAALLSDE
jgi:hypothetical protein